MKEKISDYKAVIFDLDGTLYYQKPFRIRMLIYLCQYMLLHPSSLKDILIVKEYRSVREKWSAYEEQSASGNENLNSLDTRQYEFVAEKLKVSPKRVEKAVSFFMQEAPLSLLPQYRDSVLADVMDNLRENKVIVAVYSDYPVLEKLKALQMKADYCFTAADSEINCMKPDKKGLEYILKVLNLKSDEAIMIGDRLEKDGQAAINNQIDYLILDSSKRRRYSEIKSFFKI